MVPESSLSHVVQEKSKRDEAPNKKLDDSEDSSMGLYSYYSKKLYSYTLIRSVILNTAVQYY